MVTQEEYVLFCISGETTGGGGAGDIFLRDEGKSGMGKGSCGGTSDGG